MIVDNYSNQTMILIGNGTIQFTVCETDNEEYKHGLCITEINKNEFTEKSLTDYPITLLFKNTKGIDVLIEMLLGVRKILELDNYKLDDITLKELLIDLREYYLFDNTLTDVERQIKRNKVADLLLKGDEKDVE